MNLAPKLLAELLMQSPAFRKLATAEPTEVSGAGSEISMADKVMLMAEHYQNSGAQVPGELDGRQELAREYRRAPKPEISSVEEEMAKMLLAPVSGSPYKFASSKIAAEPDSGEARAEVRQPVSNRVRERHSRVRNVALTKAMPAVTGTLRSASQAVGGAMVPGYLGLVAGESLPDIGHALAHQVGNSGNTVSNTGGAASGKRAAKPSKPSRSKEKKGSLLTLAYQKVAVGYQSKPASEPKAISGKPGKGLSMDDVHALTETVRRSSSQVTRDKQASLFANALLGSGQSGLYNQISSMGSEQGAQSGYGVGGEEQGQGQDQSQGLLGVDLGDLARTPEGIDACIKELQALKAVQLAQQARSEASMAGVMGSVKSAAAVPSDALPVDTAPTKTGAVRDYIMPFGIAYEAPEGERITRTIGSLAKAPIRALSGALTGGYGGDMLGMPAGAALGGLVGYSGYLPGPVSELAAQYLPASVIGAVSGAPDPVRALAGALVGGPVGALVGAPAGAIAGGLGNVYMGSVADMQAAREARESLERDAQIRTLQQELAEQQALAAASASGPSPSPQKRVTTGKKRAKPSAEPESKVASTKTAFLPAWTSIPVGAAVGALTGPDRGGERYETEARMLGGGLGGYAGDVAGGYLGGALAGLGTAGLARLLLGATPGSGAISAGLGGLAAIPGSLAGRLAGSSLGAMYGARAGSYAARSAAEERLFSEYMNQQEQLLRAQREAAAQQASRTVAPAQVSASPSIAELYASSPSMQATAPKRRGSAKTASAEVDLEKNALSLRGLGAAATGLFGAGAAAPAAVAAGLGAPVVLPLLGPVSGLAAGGLALAAGMYPAAKGFAQAATKAAPKAVAPVAQAAGVSPLWKYLAIPATAYGAYKYMSTPDDPKDAERNRFMQSVHDRLYTGDYRI